MSHEFYSQIFRSLLLESGLYIESVQVHQVYSPKLIDFQVCTETLFEEVDRSAGQK